MDIYVEAVTPDGELRDVGKYISPVVPRIGEKIILKLHRFGGATPHPNSILFRVIGVRYAANNHLKTEKWITPYIWDIESLSVAVEVSPESEEAREYLTRLVNREVGWND